MRTALADDPRLTVRLVRGPSPARVVIDPRGRLPNDARVLADDGARRLVIQAVPTPRPAGVEVVVLPASDGWIRPAQIRAALAERGLRRVLVEGGGRTIAGFLDAGLLQRLHVAIAPLIIGAGPSGLRTAPIARLADALRPETHVYGLDSDVIFDCALAPGQRQQVDVADRAGRRRRSPPAAPEPRPRRAAQPASAAARRDPLDQRALQRRLLRPEPPRARRRSRTAKPRRASAARQPPPRPARAPARGPCRRAGAR